MQDSPNLTLFDTQNKVQTQLAATPGKAGLYLGESGGKSLAGKFEVSSSGPTLLLSDEKGFQTAIGTTDLVTPRSGETHKTSAASLVLSDKDKKVLWKAP